VIQTQKPHVLQVTRSSPSSVQKEVNPKQSNAPNPKGLFEEPQVTKYVQLIARWIEGHTYTHFHNADWCVKGRA
jgi:hypothetical protein